MKRMKVLVTGGAGFIGSHLVDALVARGDEVAVIDNFSSGKKDNVNDQARIIEIDISDKSTASLIEKEKPELIFHLAAQALVPVSVRDPILDAKINVIGFLNVMEGAVKAKTRKVIYTSTGGAIYGDAKIIPTPETFEARPISPYGISKLSGERYLDFYREIHKIDSTILRYANVYGPRQNPFGEGGVVAIFIQKLLSGLRPRIFGDGSQTRDYVYVGDVVTANLKAADSPKIGPFNIGTGLEIATEEVFRTVQRQLKSKLEPIYADERPGDLRRSALDCGLAKREFGWSAKFDFDEGVSATVGWFKKN